MYKIRATGTTEIGSSREQDQDALVVGGLIAFSSGSKLDLAFASEKPFLITVIDGMGGYAGGNDAGGIAALEFAGITDIMNETGWRRFCAQTAMKIAMAGAAWGTPQMGAAFASLCFLNDSIISVNVGDCKSYRVFQDYFIQTSVDDKNPVSGALTQALNAMFQEYDPHYHHYRYNGKKERFIICSDGLIESLGEAVIKEQMFRPDDAGVIRREMTELAYTKRPQDNFTFIIIEIETNVNG